MKIHIYRYRSLTIASAAMTAALTLGSGCVPTPITTASFTPAGGNFPNAQTVQIELPTDADNVYLTTDSSDITPSSLCSYHGENLFIDKPTVVKLQYEINGEIHNYEQMYLIENSVEEHDYTNRKVLTTWERFFIKHVLRQFNVPSDDSSLLRIDDGAGGYVTLQTNILAKTIYGVPKKGEQLYSFYFFENTDDDTHETVMLDMGSIYGYRDKEDGFYTTLSNGGSRVKYRGTYNGWADADFKMDKDGNTTSGYYRVFCSDRGCADIPVYYVLDSKNQLVEFDPAAGNRSCTEPTTP